MIVKRPVFLSTWTLHRALFGRLIRLHDMPALSRIVGCSGVELEDIFFESTRTSYVRTIRRAVKDHGQSVLLALSNDLTVPGARAVRKAIDRTLAFLDIASSLQSPIVRILAGSRGRSKAALHQCTQAIGPILDEARSRNIRIAIENHDALTRDAGRLVGIVEELRDPGLGICLDTGNIPSSRRYGFIRACLPYAFMIHAKAWGFNNRGGETSISYAKVGRLTDAAGFRGPVVLEYDGKGDQLVGTIRLKRLVERCLSC